MGNARSKDKAHENAYTRDVTYDSPSKVLKSPRVPVSVGEDSRTAPIANVSKKAKYSKAEIARTPAADSQQHQHHLKQQTSIWSLSSLNWSLSLSAHSSFKQQRHRSYYRSLNTSQQQQQQQQQQQRSRSKTCWHKPLTNTIFSSHFKDFSRNQQFHIESLVAKGAFGAVFKVTNSLQTNLVQSETDSAVNLNNLQPPAKTVYALKILKKSKIIAENSIQQIKNEADIQKVCCHNPFIVKQIDLWQNRHNLHILSEYVPNGELFDKISFFSLDLIRLYLAEIALALDFLHNAGIIYRDAKPENILLTYEYHLKLTDFGLSKWLKFGQTTKTMCGTLQYMAPEILQGLSYTHAVDWWSLGIIVCEMFMGKNTDVKQTIANNVMEIVNKEDNIELESVGQNHYLPAEINNLPYEGQDVLKRLLQINPQQRIRSVRAMQKIAMYKDFKIDMDHVLKISPWDIIKKDCITVNNEDQFQNNKSCSGVKEFENF